MRWEQLGAGWYAAFEVGGIIRETGRSAMFQGLSGRGWYFWPWDSNGLVESARGPFKTLRAAQRAARRSTRTGGTSR